MSDRARSRSPRRDRGKPSSTSDRGDRDYDRRDSARRDDRDRRDDNSHTADSGSSSRRDRDDRERRGDNDRERPRKKKTGGFNFKDKRRDDDAEDGSNDRGGGSSSYRGYRNRSPSPRRSSNKPKTHEEDTTKPPKRAPASADTTRPPKRAPAAAVSGGPGLEMIIVHVNDRLGTKAAIPCLPSDTIRQFKIIVAARIGREPHEILLKRQGQRPFKDMLTLADYEVSNGVQLDLEVDTGD